MDDAYNNAQARKAALSTEADGITARLSDIRNEMAKIDAFLFAWAEFAGIKIDPPEVEPDTKPRPVNPPKEKVGDAVEAIIRVHDRPVPRKRLMADLPDFGINLQGTDPSMVLSTMLWRMQDRFVRVPGAGYWLKDVPHPPSGYRPEPKLDL